MFRYTFFPLAKGPFPPVSPVGMKSSGFAHEGEQTKLPEPLFNPLVFIALRTIATQVNLIFFGRRPPTPAPYRATPAQRRCS